MVVGDLVAFGGKLHRVVRFEAQNRPDDLGPARTVWFDTGIGMTAFDNESFIIVERDAAASIGPKVAS